MKILYCLLFIFSGWFSNAYCQKFPTVRVTDWNHRNVVPAKEPWSKDSLNIVKQIGPEEFEKVKNNCDMYTWPTVMSPIQSGRLMKGELTRKLNKLKVYKIATYSLTTYQGVDYTKAILRIPYSENKNWDSTAKWDVTYFIVDAEHVEEIKSGDRVNPDPPLTKIRSYENLLYSVPASYWNKNSDQILPQVGKNEFERIKIYSSQENWPTSLRARSDANGKLYDKFDSLKMYKIATYTHTDKNGKKYSCAIMRVSYNDNDSWDKTVKWNYLYFVILDKADKEVEEIR